VPLAEIVSTARFREGTAVKKMSYPGIIAILMLGALITSDCLADCVACWQLKGVVVRLKNGSLIEGYATWNDAWAEFEYKYSGKGDPPRGAGKTFPDVIFDPAARIDSIYVYTQLRSIKYPRNGALVATRERVSLSVKDIKELQLKPGPHDGYEGAGYIPQVSEKMADLLQTKPVASCEYDMGLADVYWVSYDKNFPAKELQLLCSDEKATLSKKELTSFAARGVFELYFAYD